MEPNRQEAPAPEILAALVARLCYKPGWSFHLRSIDRGQGSKGLTLDVITCTVNSYNHEQTNYRVHHYFPVPPAAYNEQSWRRWLLDQIVLVERHEACEFFTLTTDDDVLERPYAPHHGPGSDPYIVFDHGSDVDARTTFKGEVR